MVGENNATENGANKMFAYDRATLPERSIGERYFVTTSTPCTRRFPTTHKLCHVQPQFSTGQISFDALFCNELYFVQLALNHFNKPVKFMETHKKLTKSLYFFNRPSEISTFHKSNLIKQKKCMSYARFLNMISNVVK